MIASPPALVVEAPEALKRAIEQAPAGARLRLMPGRYRGPVVLTRPLSLVGAPGTILDGGGRGDVITVRAPGCRLEGLTVVGSGTELLGESAGIRLDAPRAQILGCQITACLFGIYAADSDGHRIWRNRIQGALALRQPDRGDGIRLHNAHHNWIADNQISETRDGIYVNGSSHNQIRGNRIDSVRYGLHYMYADENRFEGNRFLRTEAGAAMMFSRQISLRGNTFSGNRGYRAYGLLIKDCEDSEVLGNAMIDNRVGLFLDGALRSRFAGNWIAGNDLGIELRANSEENRFLSNAITHNAYEASLPTGAEHNTWEGNYWSQYQGYDLDRDGRGDVPHRAGSLFGFIVENLPPARLFLLGPGLEALAFAERSFPILAPPQLVDTAPLMSPPPRPAAPMPEPAPAGGGRLGLLAAGLLALGLWPLLHGRKSA